MHYKEFLIVCETPSQFKTDVSLQNDLHEQMRPSTEGLALSMYLFSMPVTESESSRNQTKQFTACRSLEPIFTFSQAKFHSELYVSQLRGSRRRFLLREFSFLTLYFVVTADTGAGSAERKRERKDEGDSPRVKIWVDLGWPFNRSRELQACKGFRTDLKFGPLPLSQVGNMRNVNNFTFLNRMTVTEHKNLLVVGYM